MNLDLTQEQLAAQGKAHDFAVEYISPVAARNDREEIFPREILNSLATTIYEGTTQIQKLIIGRQLTGENAFD